MYLEKDVTMMDTIRLSYDTNSIPEEFKFTKQKRGVFKGTLNPTKEMKESGKYYPRVTFVKRPVGKSIQQQMLVEFSVPKLIKGNNFSEVRDSDFDDVVQALKLALFEMGIKWQFTACIENYKVVKVDYSKNVVFEDGTTVSQVLRQLNSANIRKNMDASSSEFRNGGQIFHLHTNYRDIVFYDKVADLRQSAISEKRSMEKERPAQTNLFDLFDEHRNLSVLRFEVRLNGVKEIRNNLIKIGQSANDLSFKRLFSSETSRAILLNWWGEVFDKIPKAPLDDATIENVFIGLLNNPNAKPQKVFASLGMMCLQNSKNYDARFAKEVFDHRFSNGSWDRSGKLVLEPSPPDNLRHLLQIEQAIRGMVPVNIDDYSELIR